MGKLVFLFSLFFCCAAVPVFAAGTSAVMELKNVSCNEYAFDARKSQDSGQSMTYAWDFGDGQISDQASGVHVYEKSGTYRVTLTVTGAEKSETSQQIEVNVPPEAVFSAPPLVCTNEEISLDASPSKKTEDSQPVYHWDFGDGPSASGEKIKYRYVKAGDYTLTLTADDGKNSDCSISKRELSVHVNAPPVAMLSKVEPTCMKKKGRTISFDASHSHDPDGKKLSYQWDFGDGTTQAGGSKAKHKYLKSGTYKVVVTVDDGSGSQCAAVKDRIYVKINRQPVLMATLPMKARVGSPAEFDGSKSSDPDGDGLSYFWSFGDGKNSAEPKISHTYKKKGKYKIYFQINDNTGSPCSTAWEQRRLIVDDALPAEAQPEKK